MFDGFARRRREKWYFKHKSIDFPMKIDQNPIKLPQNFLGAEVAEEFQRVPPYGFWNP